MARAGRLVKPTSQDLIRLTVLRSARLSPHWVRVALGGAEIDEPVANEIADQCLGARQGPQHGADQMCTNARAR